MNRITDAETTLAGRRLLPRRFFLQSGGDDAGILLWLIGFPIPIIILLYLFGVV